jgi:hypothetical protein
MDLLPTVWVVGHTTYIFLGFQIGFIWIVIMIIIVCLKVNFLLCTN